MFKFSDPQVHKLKQNHLNKKQSPFIQTAIKHFHFISDTFVFLLTFKYTIVTDRIWKKEK